MSREPLIHLSGTAAPTLVDDINTDIIAPVLRRENGAALGIVENGAGRIFGPWRYDEAGAERPDFILNRPPFRSARFLIAGVNFGCGSSRETAVLWLRDFGIRCVIAKSFAGIFEDNCYRNGIAPLIFTAEEVDALAERAAAGGEFVLDLERRKLVADDLVLQVTLTAFRIDQLMRGLDEVELTLSHDAEIASYQAAARERWPWIYDTRR